MKVTILISIKKIGKLSYVIRLNQAIVLDHSGLHLMINFILRWDYKAIKNIFGYGFFNHLC